MRFLSFSLKMSVLVFTTITSNTHTALTELNNGTAADLESETKRPSLL